MNRSGKRAYDPRKSQVKILSVQSSKGLEFRSVILIGLDQIETAETQTAQNMKLLYVGMTWAGKKLVITAIDKITYRARLINSSRLRRFTVTQIFNPGAGAVPVAGFQTRRAWSVIAGEVGLSAVRMSTHESCDCIGVNKFPKPEPPVGQFRN